MQNEIAEANQKTLNYWRKTIDFRLSSCSQRQHETFYKTFPNGIEIKDINKAIDMTDGFIEHNKKYKKEN